MTFKPMLAATCEDLTALDYPLLASTKLDGYRCIIKDGVAVSRNLKPFPNEHVQAMLKHLPDGLDGELIVGPPSGTDVWNRSAGVMKRGTTPSFTYHVFDWVLPDEPFVTRTARLRALLGSSGKGGHVALVEQHTILSAGEMAEFEQAQVLAGYEGVMLRSLSGPYKFGRSTVREGYLLKYKRWFDVEGQIIGIVEQMENTNEATVDLLGRTKRSSAKAGKVGKDTMGALIVEFAVDAQRTARFELGTGYDDAMRQDIWDNFDAYLGKIVTFKYQSLGVDGAPRFPVFKGFRDAIDA